MDWTPVVGALLGSFVAGILGNVVAHALTRRREQAKFIVESKAKAYGDFIQAVSQRVQAQVAGASETEAVAKQTDAKLRMLLYAETVVVKALAEFERNHEDNALRNVFLRMRGDLGNRKPLPTSDVELIVFGRQE